MSPIEGWQIGDRVIDDDGETGTIIEIEDEHNVHVVIDDIGFGEGRAIYCCDPSCEEYFPCKLAPAPFSCGHQGFLSIYPLPDGGTQCTQCSNTQRYKDGLLKTL